MNKQCQITDFPNGTQSTDVNEINHQLDCLLCWLSDTSVYVSSMTDVYK